MAFTKTTPRPTSGSPSRDTEAEAPRVGGRFLAALEARDFPALASCFSENARFRALLPRGLREASGAEEPTRYFQGWFGAADRIDVLDGGVDAIGDRQHLTWRFRVRDEAGARVIEQQAYATIREDRIAELDLLCSGFRPEVESTPVVTRGVPSDEAPKPDTVIEASGESCATLTPLIRARMRALPAGAVLELRTDDPTAPESLEAWCRLTGNELIATRDNTFYLRKS